MTKSSAIQRKAKAFLVLKTQRFSIESKWQKAWKKSKVFKAKDSGKDKYYILEMFPYPSGSGLHIGHARNYAIGDSLARFKRLQGFNVLYPMGWDSFGLPAENAAIAKGIHPVKSISQNIKTMKDQMSKLGSSYDWERTILNITNGISGYFYSFTKKAWPIGRKLLEIGVRNVIQQSQMKM